jgi:hypothetical protein
MFVKSFFFLVTMKIHGFAVNPNKQKGCGKKRKLQRKALRLAVFSMLFGLGFLALFFLLFPLLLGFRVLLLLWSVAF